MSRHLCMHGDLHTKKTHTHKLLIISRKTVICYYSFFFLFSGYNPCPSDCMRQPHRQKYSHLYFHVFISSKSTTFTEIRTQKFTQHAAFIVDSLFGLRYETEILSFFSIYFIQPIDFCSQSKFNIRRKWSSCNVTGRTQSHLFTSLSKWNCPMFSHKYEILIIVTDRRRFKTKTMCTVWASR